MTCITATRNEHQPSELRLAVGGVTIIVTESAGKDDALLVIIDTDGEPDGSDGSRPIRVLVNDGTVYEGVPYAAVHRDHVHAGCPLDCTV